MSAKIRKSGELSLPLAEDVVKVLKEQIAILNNEGNLHIQLIQNEPKAFQGTMAKYGKFRNVTNYIVMAGKKADDLDERIGYYGEHLVLLAQTLGLNTCWVGLSYSKVPGTYVLDEGEKIACYIALGYGETQGVSHKIKTVEQVSNASDVTPSWFRKGVEAALLAPTAVNQQKLGKITSTGYEHYDIFGLYCKRSSLSYYYDQFFPLLIMYMPRAASPPAKAYFKWNVSPRHRHEVIAPTTGISEL